MNSYLIWLPSKQYFYRFKELTYTQHKSLLKVIDDNEIEFIYLMNDIIKTNCIDDLDIMSITTLDRFAIFLYLKIHSCGTTIQLSRKCPKCDTTSTIKMDLNILIDNIAQEIDRKFEYVLNTPIITIYCDLPSLEQEIKTIFFNNLHSVNDKTIDYILDNYIISHIRKIKIKNNEYDMDKITPFEKYEISKLLPASIILTIQKNFITPIHNIVNNIDFLKIECSKTECKEPFEIKFDIMNINDIIKIIYKDESVESYLQKIFNISSVSYIDGTFISNLSPLEVDILEDMAKRVSKKNETPTNDQQNKFTPLPDYMTDTSGMKETPSEFGF